MLSHDIDPAAVIHVAKHPVLASVPVVQRLNAVPLGRIDVHGNTLGIIIGCVWVFELLLVGGTIQKAPERRRRALLRGSSAGAADDLIADAVIREGRGGQGGKQ